MAVVDDLAKIFEETFAHDSTRFSAETVPDDVKKWDSIGHMSMVAAMEDKFGVQFEVDEIMEMVDVRKILEILEAKGIKD
ncbi:MAG: hypothetical protein GKS06_04180 [Acidobacteria bacterium]|nr:hypothetical protein [Acidobacteriota bacterium]